MKTSQAKFLAKKFGCTLTFVNNDLPGMWFLNAHPDSAHWDIAQTRIDDDQFCFSSKQLKDLTPDTLVQRIAALIS